MSGESSLAPKDVFSPPVSALKAEHSVAATLELERMVGLFVSICLCGSAII